MVRAIPTALLFAATAGVMTASDFGGFAYAQSSLGGPGPCAGCASGPTQEVPGTLWGPDRCNKYKPSKVKWESFRQELFNFMSQGGVIGPDGIPPSRYAKMLVRAAFHDAGTSQGGVGGADGSIILAADEQNALPNSVPFFFVPYIKSMLWPMVQKYRTSWADAIAVAGAVATEFMGGTSAFRLRVGRCDNFRSNPMVLPAPNVKCDQFQSYWASVGISLEDAVALMGSHSVADTANRFSTARWNSDFYRDSLAGFIQIAQTGNPSNPEAVQWNGGPWRYTVNDAAMAPQNQFQCPSTAGTVFNQYQAFAQSSQTWNDAYARAYKAMTEIGARWSKHNQEIII